MITAVDTSVLIDVFGADATYGPRSRDALQACIVAGSLVACVPVWAEVAAYFPTPDDGARAMDRLGVAFVPMDTDAALVAGAAWQAYRRRGGARTRVVTDFLIGAHALSHADRLLTRESRFHRSYFPGLIVIDPTVG